MRNKPTGTDLILVARKVLVDQIIPALSEDKRVTARMIAKAMNIASREIEAGDWPMKQALERLAAIIGKDAESEVEFAESTPGALERVVGELSAIVARRIREGEFDRESELRQQVHRHLLAATLDKLKEDDPRYLEAEGFV